MLMGSGNGRDITINKTKVERCGMETIEWSRQSEAQT